MKPPTRFHDKIWEGWKAGPKEGKNLDFETPEDVRICFSDNSRIHEEFVWDSQPVCSRCAYFVDVLLAALEISVHWGLFKIHNVGKQ